MNKEMVAKLIEAQKGILASLKETVEREKSFGMEDSDIATEAKKNIAAIEKTIKEYEQ